MTTGKHLTDEQAQRHLEGLLSPAVASDVESHLGACAGCRALVASYRALSDALDGLAAAEPPPDFTIGVMALVDARERAARRERRLATSILAAVGAAALAAFVAAGQAAWAPALASAFSSVASAASALRLAADVAAPVVGALRLPIGLSCAAVAVPLLLALARLIPSRSSEIA